MLTMRRLLGGMLAVVLVSAVAGAQTPPVRPRAHTVPTDTPEIAALRAEANAGDAFSQYNLGVMYRDGDGVPRDYAQAAAWTRKAADQGLAVAQYNLGMIYATGQGVPKDDAQAVAWTRKAAEQEDAPAQYNLGVMYATGQGVPKDDTQAVAWYRKAADQGLAVAQHNLGLMYATGQGVPQDYVESHKWRNLAASRASAENQKQFAGGRDAVAKLITPAQLADAQQRAGAWLAAFQKREVIGVAGAQTLPVRPRAQAVSTDTPEIAALRVKANAGDAGAQRNLGVRYANGQGVPRDAISAYMWLSLSAANGPAPFRDFIAYTMTPAQIASGQTLARAWLAAFEKRGGK